MFWVKGSEFSFLGEKKFVGPREEKQLGNDATVPLG